MALGYCDSVGVALGYCDSVKLGSSEGDEEVDGILLGEIEKLGAEDGF